MRLLLDTHIVLWRLTDDARLSQQAIAIMDDEANSNAVSTISIWEVAIKHARRRGRADDMPYSGRQLLSSLECARIAPIAVEPAHAVAVDELPMLHGDPFDRFLLATAKYEGMVLLTHDAALAAYGDYVRVI